LILSAAVFLAPAFGSVLAADKEEPKKVEYVVHSGYCELAEHAKAEQLKARKAKTLGNTSFLAFTDQQSFDKAFGKTPDKEDLDKFLPNGEGKGKKPNLLPNDAFDTKMVVATTIRGPNVCRYKVGKVTAEGDTLSVHYEVAEAFAGNDKVRSCPLILSVDKGKYTSVVFIQGGKKVGTAEVPKEPEKPKEKDK
jgi:hypothetical protein